MRELDDARKDLGDFKSLVRNGLQPSKSLEKVTYKDRWDLFNFIHLEFRVGQLTVTAYAHASRGIGNLDVTVWDFIGPYEDSCRFQMRANTEHVARVVVDYLNECEARA